MLKEWERIGEVARWVALKASRMAPPLIGLGARQSTQVYPRPPRHRPTPRVSQC